jgi:hypothetical protein
VLEPGDAVYIPRGMAHDAVATDETSLHVTIGRMFSTWADVLVEAIITKAHSELAMRRTLPPGYANHGVDLAAYDETFAELVAMLADTPAGKPLTKFREDFVIARVPRVEGQMAMLDSLTMDSRVGCHPDMVFGRRVVPDEDQVCMAAQGAEVILPAHARDALEFCITTRGFRLGDMSGDLDDAGKLVLARRLVREGMMRIL